MCVGVCACACECVFWPQWKQKCLCQGTRRARAEVGGTTTEVGGARPGHAPLPIAATPWPRGTLSLAV